MKKIIFLLMLVISMGACSGPQQPLAKVDLTIELSQAGSPGTVQVKLGTQTTLQYWKYDELPEQVQVTLEEKMLYTITVSTSEGVTRLARYTPSSPYKIRL